MSKVLIIVGPSGAGKTKLEDYLLGKYSKLHALEILTTRAQRKEDDLNRYKFTTIAGLQKHKDIFIYAALTPNLMYAIRHNTICEDNDYVISILNKASARRLMDTLVLHGHDVKIVFIESNANVRIQSMLDRGESDEAITNRIMGEVQDIPINYLNPDICIYPDYDYTKDFDKLVWSISNIMGYSLDMK